MLTRIAATTQGSRLSNAHVESKISVNKASNNKTTHKDTMERMVAEMEALDRLCQEVPQQEVHLEGVGLVQVEHQLVNTLHGGKERLAMTQHKVFNSFF